MLAALAVLIAVVPPVAPSSHREAPFVTEHPKVDATDFYLFRSYQPGFENNVTLVADYLPLQQPYGGPNYFMLDPEARYEIHVDNDGDALADMSFRFTFQNTLKGIALTIGPPGNQKVVSVPLLNVGAITSGDTSALNIVETYTIELVREVNGVMVSSLLADAATGSTSFEKPVDFIGTKSLPDYETYARQRIRSIALPGGSTGRVFVGQRKDPFVVNLGETFDLVNTNPLGPVDGKQDSLAGANVTAFCLELPIGFLVDENPVIAAYTTASLPGRSKLEKEPSFEEPASVGGRHVQVSRLSAPLVNEVVIGLPDKDLFNASHPKDDAQFLDYVTHPTLPALLEALFGVTAPTQFPRDDLIAAFLTGLAGVNQNGSVCEMMRLNTATPPTPAALQQNLGLLAGDAAGFPNGRRPGDDVVDIELRVAMGALLDPADAPSGGLPYTDGALTDASHYDATFPYLRSPLPGAPQGLYASQ